MSAVLTTELASRLARIALGHVLREYPHKLDHVLIDPAKLRQPRALHPIFFGSFDWHSSVHSHWLLARLLRAVPDLPEKTAIGDLFDSQFTEDKVEAECAYLAAPSARGFERPYGWAWLLKLVAELACHPADWGERLSPLAAVVVARFHDFLPKLSYPIRVGTHFNSAFALRLSLDYADAELGALIKARARRWFEADRDCPVWEPGGDEFLSPALCEAVLMRRVLSGAEFADWLAGFLPGLHLPKPETTKPATLFLPVAVTDRSDGKLAHLDGLNLSRAWCWRELASTLAPATRAAALTAADHQVETSLPHLDDDYMGEHWLASFAALALLAESGV